MIDSGKPFRDRINGANRMNNREVMQMALDALENQRENIYQQEYVSPTHEQWRMQMKPAITALKAALEAEPQTKGGWTMSDLVKRLRRQTIGHCDLMYEAADEIERLTAKLEAATRLIDGWAGDPPAAEWKAWKEAGL